MNYILPFYESVRHIIYIKINKMNLMQIVTKTIIVTIIVIIVFVFIFWSINSLNDHNRNLENKKQKEELTTALSDAIPFSDRFFTEFINNPFAGHPQTVPTEIRKGSVVSFELEPNLDNNFAGGVNLNFPELKYGYYAENCWTNPNRQSSISILFNYRRLSNEDLSYIKSRMGQRIKINCQISNLKIKTPNDACDFANIVIEIGEHYIIK